ncbi:thioredoxin-like domain-containing protein [Chitinophaga filiformis]|uniref:Metallophosphoesterase n=1 Tax=Chitinophaga filiformis TaxID=104663 RepID=A0ABY4I691_CHIFI|nr:thioredoxin-like domain-containing protein [Chitinophaga filiformis]UPK70628.1 metallophosphoesterase [Chitinophaga filiformis]
MIKMRYSILSVCFMMYCLSIVAQKKPSVKRNPPGNLNRYISLHVQVDTLSKSDSLNLQYTSFAYMVPPRVWKFSAQKIKNGVAGWTIPADDLMYIYLGSLSRKQRIYMIAEPGDSIIVAFKGDNLLFAGAGSSKFELQYKLKKLLRAERLPLDYVNKISPGFFLERNQKLNRLTENALVLLDIYKERITPLAFRAIKALTISSIEEDRLDLFWALRANAEKWHITSKNLSEIFDTCFYKPSAVWMRSQPDGFITGSYSFIRAEVFRKFEFKNDIDVIQSQSARRFLYYDQARRTYSGLTLQKYYIDLMTSQTLKEIGLTKETEELLAKYYSEPGHEEYKQYVRTYESKTRELRKNMDAPPFTLTDVNGKAVTKETFKGKVTLIDFWFSGCKGCAQLTPSLSIIEQQFGQSPDVQMVSVSIDDEKVKWLKSLNEKKYTTGAGINLYTSGKGINHPMMKAYNISSFPSLVLLDPYGRIVENPIPDPREDNGKKVIDLINRELVKMIDGPYVFYKDDSIITYSIHGSSVISKRQGRKDNITLETQGINYGNRFGFRLKPQLKVEPSEFAAVDKIFALSDIEGNLEVLIRLLKNNNVIDNDLNWTFGKGHMVFVGDIFDRGEQVTECLWLLYALEGKARDAGGYVHFILGNHEIMNLSGNMSYVKEKYKQNAARLGKSYKELYGKDSELGQWLRTKNIIEKIGDKLFVHGGVSKEVNDLPLSIAQINELARQYYDNAEIASKSPDSVVNVLYNVSDKLSPFWYRSYYLDQGMKLKYDNIKGRLDTIYKASDALVDDVLGNLGVKNIITGHTIVSDTISVHYDGKVINTDTKHAEGKSEALLIEHNNFYRVNDYGKRVFLFERSQGVAGTGRKQAVSYN